jgi:hypothetical protein
MVEKGKNIQFGSGSIPKVHMNFSASSVNSVAGNVEGDFIIDVSAEKRNIAEAAVEIQQLLEQLSQVKPSDSLSGRMRIAAGVIAHIERKPTLKKRVLDSLKAGGVSVLEQSLNHPAASFVIAALEEYEK